MFGFLKKLLYKPKVETISQAEYKKLCAQKDAHEEDVEETNPDQSVYSDDPEETQDSDMESDLALLNDEDMGY